MRHPNAAASELEEVVYAKKGSVIPAAWKATKQYPLLWFIRKHKKWTKTQKK